MNKEPNLEILEHDRKRKIELKCLELREMMEEKGYDDEAIEVKVNAVRVKLMQESQSLTQTMMDEFGRPVVSGTHQIAAANLDRNKRLREAFGISPDYVEGTSMNPSYRNEKITKKYALVKDPEEEQAKSLAKVSWIFE